MSNCPGSIPTERERPEEHRYNARNYSASLHNSNIKTLERASVRFVSPLVDRFSDLHFY